MATKHKGKEAAGPWACPLSLPHSKGSIFFTQPEMCIEELSCAVGCANEAANKVELAGAKLGRQGDCMCKGPRVGRQGDGMCKGPGVHSGREPAWLVVNGDQWSGLFLWSLKDLEGLALTPGAMAGKRGHLTHWLPPRPCLSLQPTTPCPSGV